MIQSCNDYSKFKPYESQIFSRMFFKAKRPRGKRKEFMCTCVQEIRLHDLITRTCLHSVASQVLEGRLFL